MSAALTYTELVAQIPGYCERPNDAALIAQLPMLIMLAENRIATDMKQQGFQSVVSGAFTVGSMGAVVAKPAFWRETISFNYKDPVLGWKPIKMRALEYLKNFWPLQSQMNPPRFYADYNFQNFLIAPSPDVAYPFELAYYARLEPLDATNQTNWLTLNAPQCLLYACILETQLWLKNTAKAQEWEAHYAAAKQGLMQETAERLADRAEVVTRG
jgi:hypothetical protein